MSAALRPLSIGEIFDASFQLYRREFRPLIGIVLICQGLPLLLAVFIGAGGAAVTGSAMAALIPLVIVFVLLMVVLGAVATTATTFVVSERYLGRTITAREAVSRATPFLWRQIAAGLMVGMVVGLGFLMLVVPGMILLCGLAVTWPALVLEPRSTATSAMGRSWELTRGFRLRIFGLVAGLFLVTAIPQVGIDALAGVAAFMLESVGLDGVSSFVSLLGSVLSTLAQFLLFPLVYCALTVLYYDLRVRKEGFDLELLAATLQAA